MKVVFRVDASVQMGTGHFIRCLTLAEVLRQHGAEIRFICRDHPGNLIPLLQQKKIPVSVLSAPKPSIALGDGYKAWVGDTQAEDARQTIAVLKDESADLLVVDHYGLEIDWEQKMRPYVKKLMVIDDLANRHHDCDLLLDQNFSEENEAKYAGLVSPGCRLLVGPRYALLNPAYNSLQSKLGTKTGVVRRIFVYFGGSDPSNMTGLALQALSSPALRHLAVDLVIGANNSNRAIVEENAATRGGVRVFGPLPNLAELMIESDLAIGAGGATTWERMCLGLPSIVISIAENQRPSSKALAKKGLIQYAGHYPNVTSFQLSTLISEQLCEVGKLDEVRCLNRLLVDGIGVYRVAEVLCPSDKQVIKLRAASIKDVGQIFDWANDSLVRANAVNGEAIPWQAHKIWFGNKIRSKDSFIYVLESDLLPLGQIRFDRQGDVALIDYSLDAIARGRGWAHLLINLGIEKIWNVSPQMRLRAEVKFSNIASAAVFRRLDFSEELSKSGEFLVFNKESSIYSLRSNAND